MLKYARHEYDKGAYPGQCPYKGYKENKNEKEWGWGARNLQLYANVSLAAGDAKQRQMKPRNLGSTSTELLCSFEMEE